jgi:hypothetical protein
MIRPRTAIVIFSIAAAAAFFWLGAIYAGRVDAATNAEYNARLDALRVELNGALTREVNAVGTAGARPEPEALAAERSQLITDIKEQLRREMGLLPVSLLRDRRSSFVELHAYDTAGEKTYGTAGYLGDGYFITVKHAVIALPDNTPGNRAIASVKIVYGGREVPARIIDAGKAKREVDPGDWAIIRTRDLDLPPLTIDAGFAYEFAEPIFRLGNDYSKGIVVSTGYIGQRTDTGLVTALTDGHPGVSGGGVLDQRGVLVGIPIGRMQGDYRFSFILPLRQEMLRKVPAVAAASPAAPLARR